MSLTYDEARLRAGLVADIHTEVTLDLTRTDDFDVVATIRFISTGAGEQTFLELVGASEVVARLDDREAPYSEGRIALHGLGPAGTAHQVRVSARMPYVTDGDGMTTMTDPADGERYVCAYTGMDVAQKVIPCFDQPDLKTTFALSVTAPEHWTVLANGRELGHGGGHWTFAPTPPIATYLFFVCGGPWASVTWDERYPPAEGGTLPFGWHARASRRADLERDAGELRRITSSCFQHYTSVFDPPYPFEDYQQVFSPGLNWGAMEFPGCVSFRDELLVRGTPTAIQQQDLASVIAHEMAHMWFGDLVTMVWWEDSWLNESFADFMGYEIADVGAGYADSWTACALGRKPTAYRADLRRSTHRIAEDPEALVDVDTAFNNFDMITYAKGNAVLRQLGVWLGTDDFLAGVNRHLSAHAFGNATLADFLDALDGASERDVRSWAEAWLRTTGFDRIEVTRDGDVPVLTRVGSRPHRFTVTAYDDELAVVASTLVDLAEAPVRLPEMAGRIVVPNSEDETYAALVLDDRSWAAVLSGLSRVASPLTRALLWSTAVHRCEDGGLPVADLVALAREQLAAERHPVVFEGALDQVLRVVGRYADPAELPMLLEELAATALAVTSAGDPALVPAAARVLARTSGDRDLLGSWLDGDAPLPAAEQDVRWLIVQRLSALGDGSRVETELGRDRTTAGEQAALTARSLDPSVESKARMWSQLMSGELSNREFTAVAHGFWGWGQHELVAPYLSRYLEEAAALAARSGQAMGDVIGRAFPRMPQPAATLEALRAELAAALTADLPTVLARGWADDLDDLDRVRRARRTSR